MTGDEEVVRRSVWTAQGNASPRKEAPRENLPPWTLGAALIWALCLMPQAAVSDRTTSTQNLAK